MSEYDKVWKKPCFLLESTDVCSNSSFSILMVQILIMKLSENGRHNERQESRQSEGETYLFPPSRLGESCPYSNCKSYKTDKRPLLLWHIISLGLIKKDATHFISPGAPTKQKLPATCLSHINKELLQLKADMSYSYCHTVIPRHRMYVTVHSEHVYRDDSCRVHFVA